MAHEHNHDHGDHDHTHEDVELIEEGTTPAADASQKKGPEQTWRTYAPVLSSLLLLLAGMLLDHVAPTWFRDPVRLLWYVVAYLPVGWPVVRRTWSGIIRGDVFTEFFLMSVATLGAFGASAETRPFTGRSSATRGRSTTARSSW